MCQKIIKGGKSRSVEIRPNKGPAQGGAVSNKTCRILTVLPRDSLRHGALLSWGLTPRNQAEQAA